MSCSFQTARAFRPSENCARPYCSQMKQILPAKYKTDVNTAKSYS
ncbi:hypothetical protein NEIELOOT_01245 [Neisseria elongata subsp. glycolytica ATCC 29315]|uniref:Uncharacterized protein n=1 Tax=Neisseria elongata subsp. glycolytica ATCC 29315 TaxID=546263 RepID=D4DQA8_NEIEG|nr:hypothetical protein NEIELOOT_01245 [Neisseria elongata subsp. glycolytica ATCC 29315]